MKIAVDQSLIACLEKYNIFTSRSGMNHKIPTSKMRWNVGDSLDFEKGVEIEEFSTIAAGNCLYSIGSFSGIASPFPARTQIGRYVEIATGCRIMGYRHPIEAVSINSAIFNFFRENVYPYFKKYEIENEIILNKTPVPTPQPSLNPIVIGHDVWLGNDVIIAGGVSIGVGSIVAANAVVTKDVPPYSVVAGIPATIKKLRFPEKIIYKLVESSWWDYELGDLFKFDLNLACPEEFIDQFAEIKDSLKRYTPKVFRPFHYLLKQKYGTLLPSSYIATEHLSLLGLDLESLKIIQSDSRICDNFFALQLLRKEGKIYLFVPIINKYISKIKSNLIVELSDTPVSFVVQKNKNNTISIKINGLYLSSEKNGNISFREWCRDWEQFFIGSNFD